MSASNEYCIPCVGGIIERQHQGKLQLLIQTRWKPNSDPLYSGTFEFVIGKMDHLYENVYDTLRRELKEELGLELKRVINDSQTQVYSPKEKDASFAFQPFCCIQQLKEGRPWVGFVFRCEVEDRVPTAQPEEVKDPVWMDVKEVKNLFEDSPEKFFTFEVAAWEYYFKKIKV